MSNKANNLINESSPYLLQHAYNPVNWHAWNEKTLEKAKNENKPLLISIGYSTCHWCHVMERECFEDESVAQVMNENFISIKVDREEHPDVDSYYMDALQRMTGSGGWPLNIIALPDGRPVWGVTYLPPQRWKHSLTEVSKIIKDEFDRALSVAENLDNNLNSSNIISSLSERDFNLDDLKYSVNQLKNHLDFEWGSYKRAPKFPQPNNYRFLLHLNDILKDEEIESFILTSVEKMSLGGIRDWIGGGFARYSVDEYWKVPHFEKMLYDNSQLMRLYSDLYKKYKDDFYKEIIYEIHNYIQTEMTYDSKAFYSALDADSEGVEGKYYVWDASELKRILKEDFEMFSDYFNIEENGNWEEGNIVFSSMRKEVYCEINSIDEGEFTSFIERCSKLLKEERNKRIPPSKDDKIIVSWNALMSTAYYNAYEATNDYQFLKIAKKNTDFLLNLFYTEGKLYHTLNKEKGNIEAYFEDYAFLIENLLRNYSNTALVKYYKAAADLSDFVIERYYDNETKMFSLNSTKQAELLGKKFEIEDNVVPSSNSVMAQNLFILNRIHFKQDYQDILDKMSALMTENILKFPLGYSNWGILKLWESNFNEIAIVGESSLDILNELKQKFNPFSLIVASQHISNLDLFKGRFVTGDTLIYKCVDKACSLPVRSISEL